MAADGTGQTVSASADLGRRFPVHSCDKIAQIEAVAGRVGVNRLAAGANRGGRQNPAADRENGGDHFRDLSAHAHALGTEWSAPRRTRCSLSVLMKQRASNVRLARSSSYRRACLRRSKPVPHLWAARSLTRLPETKTAPPSQNRDNDDRGLPLPVVSRVRGGLLSGQRSPRSLGRCLGSRS